MGPVFILYGISGLRIGCGVFSVRIEGKAKGDAIAGIEKNTEQ